MNEIKSPLLCDYIFKRAFLKDKTNGALKDFLEAVLDVNITKVEIKNSEMPKDVITEKASILDIRAEIDNSKIVDIELQVKNEYNIDKRSTLYMSKNISTQLERGDKYTKLKPSIVINILDFEYYKRNSYHHVSHMKFEETKEKEYVEMGYKEEEEVATDILEMHFIELPKFIKKNPKIKNKLEEWLWLIAGREDKVKMSKLENPEVQKAIKLVKEIMQDPKEREIYDAKLMAEWNYKSGMEGAREAGEKKSKIETAKEMLKENINIELIKKCTKLTEEEIKELEVLI